MRKSLCAWTISLIVLITFSCNLPMLQGVPSVQTSKSEEIFPSPVKTNPGPQPLLPTDTPEAPQPPVSSIPQCAYSWASRLLSAESAKIQKAIKAAGIKSVTVIAEAYGENCTGADGKVVSFSTMQTDFRFTDTITDTKDSGLMGKQVEQLIQLVESFPDGTFPGPQKGYIGVAFREGGKEINLWFTRAEAQAALQEGLQGEALFKRLRHEP